MATSKIFKEFKENEKKSTVPSVVNNEPEVIGYTIGAKKVKPDADNCVAKVATDLESGNSRYWLKRATSGLEAGRLFNPHGPGYTAASAKRFWAETGKNQYEFRKATQESFELYMKFLESGNELHLRQAERV